MTKTPRIFVLSLVGAFALVGISRADIPAAAMQKPAEPFTVTVAKVAAKKGQPATAEVIITAAKGWHLNKDFPSKLKLRPPAGVTSKKAEFSKGDMILGEQEGRISVVLTSAEAGRKLVPGDLSFAVCTDTTCDPKKSSINIEMDVK